MLSYLAVKYEGHWFLLTLSEPRYILHFKFSHPPKKAMLHKNGFSSLQRALAKLNHATGKHSYAFAFFFSSPLCFFFAVTLFFTV